MKITNDLESPLGRGHMKLTQSAQKKKKEKKEREQGVKGGNHD